jgi:hypothetical protein
VERRALKMMGVRMSGVEKAAEWGESMKAREETLVMV